jgi:hypothetical protein
LVSDTARNPTIKARARTFSTPEWFQTACIFAEDPSLNFAAGDFGRSMARAAMILLLTGNDSAASKLVVEFSWDRSDDRRI